MIKKFDDNDLQEIKDVVRIGMVSSVNPDEMKARVQSPDINIVTGDLKILNRMPHIAIEIKDLPNQVTLTAEPWIPNVGDWVLCIFLPGGDGDGFIIGGI